MKSSTSSAPSSSISSTMKSLILLRYQYSCNHDRVLRFADFVNISQFINSSMSSSIRQWVRQFVNEFVNSSTSSSIIVRTFKLNWRTLYELPLTNWRTHWRIDEFIDEPANSLTNWWNRWRTDQLIYKLTIPLMKWKTHWRNDANCLMAELAWQPAKL